MPLLTAPQDHQHTSDAARDDLEIGAPPCAHPLLSPAARLAFDNLDSGVAILDHDGIVCYVNEAAKQMLGIGRRPVVGVRLLDLPWRTRDAAGREIPREEHPALVALRTGGSQPETILSVLRADDLVPVWLAVSARMVARDVRDVPTPHDRVVLSTFRNVSAEYADARSLDVVHSLVRSIGESEDVEQAVEILLSQLCQSLGWAYAEAWFPQRAGSDAPRLVRSKASYAAPRAGRELDLGVSAFAAAGTTLRFAPGEGLPGHVWSTGVAIESPDLLADPRFLRVDLARIAGFTHGLTVPIRSAGEVTAVLGFFGAQPQLGSTSTAGWASRSIHFIETVAAQLGSLIEKRRAADTMASERAFLAAVLESITEAIVACDADGDLAFANRAARELHGLAAGHPAALDPYMDASPAAAGGDSPAPLIQRVLARVFDSQTVLTDADLVLEAQGAERRTLVTNGRVLRDGAGDVLGAVVTARDATAQRRAEAELALSEQQFRSAFDCAAIGISLVAPDGRWLKVNRAQCELVGYSETELLERAFKDLTHPDDVAADLENVRALLAGETDTLAREKRYIHKAGHVVWVQLNVSLVRDAMLRPISFVVQTQDISAARRADEERTRLVEILEGTTDFVGLMHPDGRTLFLNKAGRRMYGLGDDESLDAFSAKEAHPPEVLERIFAEALPVAMRDGAWAGESVLLTRDGRRVPVWQIIVTHRSAAGEVEYLSTIMRDLSAQKAAEESLAAERAFLAGIVGGSADGIVAWDRDLRCVLWNPAMERHTGRTAAQAIGTHAFELVPSMKDNQREAAYQAALAGRSVTLNGAAFRHPSDGSEGWTDERYSPLLDEAGTVVGGIGLVRDVTEHRRSEEALRESERRLREILATVRSIAVCLDTSGHITYANDALLALTGWTREEVLGANWFDLFIPQASGAAVRFHEFMTGGAMPPHWENEILTVTGERRLVSWDNTVLRGPSGNVVGTASLGRDVTAQRESEAASARLVAILDAMPDAVAIATPRGDVPYLNDAARRLLGIPLDGAAVPAIATPAYIGALGPHLTRDRELGGPMRQAIREGAWTGETTCRAATGDEVPVQQTLLTHRGSDGQVEYFSTILRDITERKRTEEELRTLSLVDPLTGLFNRRGFLAVADQQLQLAKRSPRSSLLFYFDLNRFKAVNDTWGHAAGDIALTRVGEIMRVTFRESDVLGRIGGDEFVALALNCGDARDDILGRMELEIATHNERLVAEGLGFAISIAEGHTRFDPASPRTLDQLLHDADAALYEAKRRRD